MAKSEISIATLLAGFAKLNMAELSVENNDINTLDVSYKVDNRSVDFVVEIAKVDDSSVVIVYSDAKLFDRFEETEPQLVVYRVMTDVFTKLGEKSE